MLQTSRLRSWQTKQALNQTRKGGKIAAGLAGKGLLAGINCDLLRLAAPETFTGRVGYSCTPSAIKDNRHSWKVFNGSGLGKARGDLERLRL